MPIVLKSGSLNVLEPSGPVQACNGIVLPLPFKLLIINFCKVRIKGEQIQYSVDVEQAHTHAHTHKHTHTNKQ